VIRADFIGEAKAQAIADAFGEMVPHRQRIVLVSADDQVNVIRADRARVAGVSLRADEVADRLGGFLTLAIIDPEDGKV
jgi:hypothetical protein